MNNVEFINKRVSAYCLIKSFSRLQFSQKGDCVSLAGKAT